jgi:hypothetical protein
MIKTAALLFGMVFVLIGILGFVPAVTPDDALLGPISNNTANTWLHMVLAVMLFLGFGASGSKAIV